MVFDLCDQSDIFYSQQEKRFEIVLSLIQEIKYIEEFVWYWTVALDQFESRLFLLWRFLCDLYQVLGTWYWPWFSVD